MMELRDIVNKVSENTGISAETVEWTIKAYWRAIREYIASLPLKKDLTEEEFSKLRPNINIPSIGKLYVTFDKYKRMKESFNTVKKINEREYVAHQED